MLLSKQLFTCCLLVALSYTSASDDEPTFNNDNVRAALPQTTRETLDVCSEDLVEVECCAKADNGLHTLASRENVYCSNGWAVFQRRIDGSIPDFHEKSWNEYVVGFGDVSGEFWLGLRKIYRNTKQGGCRLRVDLEDFDYDVAYEEYSQFSVADEADLFRLSVGNFSGPAGDSLTYNNGWQFSTNNKDHDGKPDENCAELYYAGGWWHRACFDAAPNGVYGETRPGGYATKWKSWKLENPMKFIQMGVRCD